MPCTFSVILDLVKISRWKNSQHQSYELICSSYRNIYIQKIGGNFLMSVLGLTKKQFLKRSKECLDAQGIHALNLHELIDLELSGKINKTDSYTRIRAIMKDLDSIFNKYQHLNPPSGCIKTKREILNSLLLLQETATAVYDSTQKELNKDQGFDKTKLADSKLFLNKFRQVFRPLTMEIDENLNV